MRKPRRNPADLNAVYRKLLDAVDKALRAVVSNDGSAKVFQPLDPSVPLGSARANMDLLQIVAGGWRRTGKPYEAAECSLVEYLAFAYAAERACLSAGETKAADIFAFIRSCPADAKKVASGYPAKGGVSRILMSGRNGFGRLPMHCTSEMLQIENPLDALAFARSELWPIGDKWVDGWAAVDKRVRSLRPANCAWRDSKIAGPEDLDGVMQINLDQVRGGLLGAGAWLSSEEKPANGFNADLRKHDLRGANLGYADMRKARFRLIAGARLFLSRLASANLARLNASRTDFNGADLTRANFDGADLTDSQFVSADLTETSFRGASMQGASISETRLTDTDFRDADLRGASFFDTSFAGVKLQGADLTDATQDKNDPWLPGWRRDTNGVLHRE